MPHMDGRQLENTMQVTYAPPSPRPTHTLEELADICAPWKMRADALARLSGMLYDVFTACPALQTVSGYGYTPAWNDGDVCDHEHYITANYDENHCDLIITPDLDELDAYSENGRAAARVLRNDPPTPGQWSGLARAISDSEVAEALAIIKNLPWQETLGTNWKVHVGRTEHGIVLNLGDYDCGY